MAALTERDGISAQALRFVILTAARTGEVRGMRWREVDLDAKVWAVPGDRMKAGRLHRVALSPAALAALAEVRPVMKRSGDLVFPGGRQGKPLSDMALSEVVRRMNDEREEGALPRWRDAEGRAVVPHGFRSTFRDWAGETRPEGREVVEAALAHTIKDKAEAAYARSDLLEKRRPLMDEWGMQCAAAVHADLPKQRQGEGPGRLDWRGSDGRDSRARTDQQRSSPRASAHVPFSASHQRRRHGPRRSPSGTSSLWATSERRSLLATSSVISAIFRYVEFLILWPEPASSRASDILSCRPRRFTSGIKTSTKRFISVLRRRSVEPGDNAPSGKSDPRQCIAIRMPSPLPDLGEDLVVVECVSA